MAVFERRVGRFISIFIVSDSDSLTGFTWDRAREAYAAAKRRDFAQARKLWAAAAAQGEHGAFLRGEWAFWRGVRQRYRWLRCW